MESVITYTACPACNAPTIAPVLKTKDYTVSQQAFEIWECSACTLRFTQSVPDEQHIGPYYRSENYISHTNTGKGLVNKLYHMVRRHTLRSKCRLIERSGNWHSRTLLDVGAGTGAFVHYMRQHAWQVTGLEPDEAARKVALETFRINLLPPDHLWALPADSIDVITLWHVLEHVHRLHDYMRQLKTLLKPGGLLFIAVPNYTSADAAIYGEHWAAYDVPRHLYHFSPKAMQQLVRQHGMRIQNMQPMWFDSFYVSMLSNKYKTGKTGMLQSIWNGLRSNQAAMRHRDRCSSLIYIITP